MVTHKGEPVCIFFGDHGIIQISNFGQSDRYKVISDCFNLHFLIIRECGHTPDTSQPVKFPHSKMILFRPLDYFRQEVSCLLFCLYVCLFSCRFRIIHTLRFLTVPILTVCHFVLTFFLYYAKHKFLIFFVYIVLFTLMVHISHITLFSFVSGKCGG